MPLPLKVTLLALAALGFLGLVIYTFVRALRRSEDPVRLIVKWLFTVLVAGTLFWFARDSVKTEAGAFIVPFACVFVGVIMSVVWAPSIGAALISSITAGFDGGSEPIEPAPLYSTAEGLRRRGKFRESIYAIQEQLQKFPQDCAGQMLLAEIQAENLQDLAAAELTIHRFCEQSGHAPASLAFALSSLADWQMKLAQDGDAARSALEKIIALLPDTEFARSAGQRIAHLASSEMLVRQRAGDTIVLKPGVEYLGLLKDQSHLLPKEKPFPQEAAELSAHLDAHPLDHEARERLALIYARHYGRLDFATVQLEQLIALPGESPKHVNRWLNLLADLQVEATGKTELAEETLRRIIDLFPNHSHAAMAEQRLASLGLELNRYKTSRVVKFSSGSNSSSEV